MLSGVLAAKDLERERSNTVAARATKPILHRGDVDAAQLLELCPYTCTWKRIIVKEHSSIERRAQRCGDAKKPKTR